MPAKRATGVPLPDPFVLDENTLAWMDRRYPMVDAEIAVERFTSWSCEYLYANWQKCFQNWLTREADNNKLGPMTKKPKTPAELFRDKAVAAGFRPPEKGESFKDYEAAFEARGKQDVRRVMSMVKDFGK